MTDDLDFDMDGAESDDLSGDNRAADDAQNRFVAKVNGQIKLLVNSRNVEKRRAAAYWLGESGEPKAIPALKNVYQDDRSKEVRDAAKYALGMFKALDDALGGSDKQRDDALERIQDIVLKNKMGKRAALSPAILTRVQVGLAVVLVILVTLNILIPVLRSALSNIPQQTTEDATPTPVPSADPAQMVADVRVYLTQINDDSRALQRQFLTIRRGEAPDCTIVFNDVHAYVVPPELAPFFPDVAAMVTTLNSSLVTLQPLKDSFNAACQGSAPPLTADAVAAPLESVTTVLQDLRGFEARLDTADQEVTVFTPPAPTDVPVPTEAPLVTEEPTIEPTATLSASEVQTYLNALDHILGEARATRGPVELLVQYWADVRSAGGTGGCQTLPPEIPANYDLTEDPATYFPAEISDLYPELEDAAAQIDLGLKLLQDGWNVFNNACQNSDLVAQAATGEQYVAAAQTAFDGAAASLDTLFNRLRSGG